MFLEELTMSKKEKHGHSGHLVSKLDDIKGFHGNRATLIQDNHSFWKRVLSAYGTEAKKKFSEVEARQQDIRMARIRSAPNFREAVGSDEGERGGKLLPRRRTIGERGWNGEMGAVAENRAMKLRIEHNRRLSSVNKFAGLTRMDDYQPEMRANTSSHSARFPRFVQKEKTSIDPEWGEEEYDIYIYHNKNDRTWVSKWLKQPLQSKRFNVKMRSTKNDIDGPHRRPIGASRIIIVLTPDFIRNDFHGLCKITCSSYILAIKLKQCDFPDELNCTSYIDLCFKDMTDMTLQNRLLPKLISSLQLPRSICS